jgi:hypothetical protein
LGGGVAAVAAVFGGGGFLGASFLLAGTVCLSKDCRTGIVGAAMRLAGGLADMVVLPKKAAMLAGVVAAKIIS